MDLIVIPFHDYKAGQRRGFRDRDSHFVEYLIGRRREFRRILIVDRPTSLVESAVRRETWHSTIRKVAARGPGWVIAALEDNVFVLDVLLPATLAVLRHRRSWWLHAYRSDRLARVTKRAIELLEIKNAVVTLHHPFGSPLVDRLPHRGLVFDAMDNFLKIRHFSEAWPELERIYVHILMTSDKILAVSKECRANIFANAEKVVVVPNGVDPAFFRECSPLLAVKELDGYSGPIVGFVGTLADRIDLACLEGVARECQDFRFVLFGPIVRPRAFRRVMKLPNVFFPGEINYRHVPGIIKRFDVCMLPMKTNSGENDGDSIKLYEYIVADRPIICTPIKGIDQFRPYLGIADSKDDFVRLLHEFRGNGFQTSYPPAILDGLSWTDRGDVLFAAIVGAAGA